MAPRSGTDARRESELVDDRALRTADPDAFRLDDFAAELTDLVISTATPANIAIYGAWGSGKTSLANLLANRLERQPGVRFAKFDAFKYAETPLRRHFLSQVARALRISDEEFREGLYRSTTPLCQ